MESVTFWANRVFIIEAWVLDKVSIILSKSDNFFLDDPVVVADMWAGSYVGNWFESLVDFGENWVLV